jgi:hypothetical protein
VRTDVESDMERVRQIAVKLLKYFPLVPNYLSCYFHPVFGFFFFCLFGY